jgi:hypothetical protein
MTAREAQRSAALEEANRVRGERAAVKRRVFNQTMSIEEALALECVQRMTLLQLLSAQRRWGRLTAKYACTRLQVSPAKCVEELTDRQRLSVIAACKSTTRSAA